MDTQWMPKVLLDGYLMYSYGYPKALETQEINWGYTRDTQEIAKGYPEHN